jgi:hypothetical protein
LDTSYVELDFRYRLGATLLWGFDTPGGTDGWTAGGQVAQQGVAGGAWTVGMTTGEAVLSSPPLWEAASEYRELQARMRVSAAATVCLDWEAGPSSPDSPCPVLVPIAADGQWHVVRVPLPQAWSGTVRSLALVIAATTPQGASLDLDWLLLTD